MCDSTVYQQKCKEKYKHLVRHANELGIRYTYFYHDDREGKLKACVCVAEFPNGLGYARAATVRAECDQPNKNVARFHTLRRILKAYRAAVQPQLNYYREDFEMDWVHEYMIQSGLVLNKALYPTPMMDYEVERLTCPTG